MSTSVRAGFHLSYVLILVGLLAESFKFDTCCDGLGADSVLFTVPTVQERL